MITYSYDFETTLYITVVIVQMVHTELKGLIVSCPKASGHTGIPPAWHSIPKVSYRHL